MAGLVGPRAAARPDSGPTDRGLRLAARGPHAPSPRRPQAGTTQAGGTEAGRADSQRRPAAQRLDAATRRHWEGGVPADWLRLTQRAADDLGRRGGQSWA